MDCEGYTRTGGIMSFGPVSWSKCRNKAVVIITGTQSACDGTGEREPFGMPACKECWQTAIDTEHIDIDSVKPLPEPPGGE